MIIRKFNRRKTAGGGSVFSGGSSSGATQTQTGTAAATGQQLNRWLWGNHDTGQTIDGDITVPNLHATEAISLPFPYAANPPQDLATLLRSIQGQLSGAEVVTGPEKTLLYNGIAKFLADSGYTLMMSGNMTHIYQLVGSENGVNVGLLFITADPYNFAFNLMCLTSLKASGKDLVVPSSIDGSEPPNLYATRFLRAASEMQPWKQIGGYDQPQPSIPFNGIKEFIDSYGRYGLMVSTVPRVFQITQGTINLGLLIATSDTASFALNLMCVTSLVPDGHNFKMPAEGYNGYAPPSIYGCGYLAATQEMGPWVKLTELPVAENRLPASVFNVQRFRGFKNGVTLTEVAESSIEYDYGVYFDNTHGCFVHEVGVYGYVGASVYTLTGLSRYQNDDTIPHSSSLFVNTGDSAIYFWNGNSLTANKASIEGLEQKIETMATQAVTEAMRAHEYPASYTLELIVNGDGLGQTGQVHPATDTGAILKALRDRPETIVRLLIPTSYDMRYWAVANVLQSGYFNKGNEEGDFSLIAQVGTISYIVTLGETPEESSVFIEDTGYIEG